MAKRISIFAVMFILVVAMLVPMLTMGVSADTNKAYAVWGFDGSRSGGGYNQVMFGGGGNESTAGARYIKMSFVFRGFVNDATYSAHPHSIGMYTPNTCGMGYSLEAGGAFYKTGIWTDTDGLNSGHRQTAYTLVPNKNYDFEWYINKNSMSFKINGTQVATASGITNDGWTIFVPQGVHIDIYYVMLYRYSVNNIPSNMAESLTWGAGMGALGGGADCDSFGTGLGLTCFGTTSGAYWVYDNYPCERVYLGTDLNAVNAYNAINALPAAANVTLSNESAINSARSAYNALSSGFQSYIKDTSFAVYSKLTAAEQVITDIKAANSVITNINNIGTVTVNSGSAITTARTNYNNLTSAQKNRVSNYSTLTAAETEYNTIRNVYDKIAAIGTVTVNSGTAISNARTPYNALTSAQKNKITNYSTLTAAETEYNTIRNVYDKIAAIGTVTVNSGTAISNARTPYNALTSAQKNKITNYSTLTAAETEYNAIRPVYDAIANLGTITPSSGTAITNAENSYSALTSAQKNKITNYSTLTAARTEYNAQSTYISKVNALSGTPDASTTWKDKISQADTAYASVSNTSAVSSYHSTHSSQSTAYTNAVNTEGSRINGLINAIGTVTLNSRADIIAAEQAINSSTNSYWGNTDVQAKVNSTQRGKVTTARNTYDGLVSTEGSRINGLINAIGTVTLDSRSAIIAAENAVAGSTMNNADVAALVDSTQQGKVTTARSTYNGLVTAEVSRINGVINAIGTVTLDSRADIIAAENEVAGITNEDVNNTSTGVTTAQRNKVTTARSTYDGLVTAEVSRINTLINKSTLSTVTLASISDIEAAEAAVAGITNEDVNNTTTGVTTAQRDKVTAARSAYTARIPTASISGTPDSSKVKANIYFTLKSDEDLSAITISVNGVTGTLQSFISGSNPLFRTSDAGGGKTNYILSTTMPAKKMTDTFAYSISGYGETYHIGTTTVKAYCEALLSYTGEKQAEVRAVAQAMLWYGGAAQTYFGYNTSNMASTAAPTFNGEPATSALVAELRFDSTAIRAYMMADASMPVYYSGYNMTFLDDTTLYLAFKIKDDSTAETRNAALTWVRNNVTFGGAAVTASNSSIVTKQGNSYFVQIWLKNIPIANISSLQQINICNGAFTDSISVAQYIKAAQESGTENLKKLTLALYVYALTIQDLIYSA